MRTTSTDFDKVIDISATYFGGPVPTGRTPWSTPLVSSFQKPRPQAISERNFRQKLSSVCSHSVGGAEKAAVTTAIRPQFDAHSTVIIDRSTTIRRHSLPP